MCTVCDDDGPTIQQLDEKTVQVLPGKTPGAFTEDHEALGEQFKCRQLFGSFPDTQREALWSKVCDTSRRCLLPSLFTFSDDRKFLAGVAKCMVKIIDDEGPGGTIPRRLTNMFRDADPHSDRYIVQRSDAAFETVPGDAALRLDPGLHQLSLAAFRVYEELPARSRRRKLLAKARADSDDSSLLDLSVGVEMMLRNELAVFDAHSERSPENAS